MTIDPKAPGLPLLRWPSFDPAKVDAFVTTRDGGVSTGSYASLNLGLHVGDRREDVLANRQLLAQSARCRLDDLVFCEQTHRANVLVATEEHRGRGVRSRDDAVADTDAMVTTTPGLLLVMMVADCVPLVLHDPVAQVLGCVHAGWAGTVRGVTAAAVAAMRELGANAEHLAVGIGPSIAAADYQVGADVHAAAEEAFGEQVGEVVTPDRSGRWTFDLLRANELQLEAAGVRAENVYRSGYTTGKGTPFFSHRAEQPCGRFAAMARLKADSSA